MKDIKNPNKMNKTEIADKVTRIVERFEEEKGALKFTKEGNPLDGLVLTLLSHSTNDDNRDRAWDKIKETYPDWASVHNAPHEELAAVVRVAGLNRQKAARIQAMLGYLLGSEGKYSADFLRGMNFDQAFERLGHLKGVGLKTLAVVMAFELGEDVFPVDTHVHRLSKRFGIVPEKFNAVKTFHSLRDKIPEGKSYQFHLHLIYFGRETCQARKPKCDSCFIKDECLYINRMDKENA